MSKMYDVVNANGEQLRATFKEAKEKGYTILVKTLGELQDDESFGLEDGTMLSINFRNEVPLSGGDEGEVFFYEGAPVLPEDPAEGEEGFDDKFNYD